MSHRKRGKKKKIEEEEDGWDAELASNAGSVSSSDSDSYSDRDSIAEFSSLELDPDDWDFESDDEKDCSTGENSPNGNSGSLVSIAGKLPSNRTTRQSPSDVDEAMFPNLQPSDEEKSEKSILGEESRRKKSFGLRLSERTTGTPSSTISTLSSSHDGEFPTISTDFQPQIVKLVNCPGIIPQILCVCADSVINRYRLDDGQALHPSLLGHRDRVTCLATSNLFQSHDAGFGRRDMRMVAVSGGRDGEIRLWDLVNGECLTQIVAYSVISPRSGLPFLCGSVAVAVRSNGQIQIVSSGGESSTVTRLPHPASSSSASSGGSSSRKVLDDVHVWDGVSGRKLRTLHHPRTEEGVQHNSAISDSRVTSLLLHQPLAMRSLLFTAGAYPEIFIWDSEEAVLLCILRGHYDIISSIAISSVLQASLATSWLGKLSMVDPLGTGDDSIETIHDILACASPIDETTMPLHPNDFTIAARGAAARREVVLVSSSRDKTVRVWDILKGRTRFVLEQHQAPVQSIATFVSPPGTLNIGGGIPLCISVGDDGLVCVWNLQTGKLINRTAKWHRDSSTFALPSAAGRSTASNIFIRSVDVTIVTSTAADNTSTSPRSLSTFQSMLHRSADRRHRKVFITTCAWNNSIQCHELNRDLLLTRHAPSALSSVSPSLPSLPSVSASSPTPAAASSAVSSRWTATATASCCIS